MEVTNTTTTTTTSQTPIKEALPSSPVPLILSKEELAELEAGYQAWLEGNDYQMTVISEYEGSDGYDE